MLTSLRRDGRPLRGGVGYLAAVVATSGATGLVLLLPRGLWLTTGVLVYLITVLAVATVGGRGVGVVAAVLSFAAFNFFFTEPRFTLSIDDATEWFALLAYLVVAVVTSQLAAGQRQRYLDARDREAEARLLHDLSDLLAGSTFPEALAGVAERLRAELGAHGVMIEVDSRGEVRGRVVAGGPEAAAAFRGPAGPVKVLGEGVAASASGSGVPGRWVRVAPPHRPVGGRTTGSVARAPIRRGGEIFGQIAVSWPTGTDIGAGQARLLDTAADQLAAAVERERLRAKATEAEIHRRTSQLKSELLDAVSHDMRTPLAGIIASAGSIRQTDVDWTDEERVEFARTIEHEAERLNRIVGNLLDLSRIQAGALHPARAWHDPSLVLGETAERLRARVAEHRFTIDIPDELSPAFIDPVEIDQVVTNLVENAAKYAPRGTEIRLAAADQDGTLVITVEDDGPGIPTDSLHRLFEPFYRGGRSPSTQGSGLGLALAKGLVEAHGGTIGAENRAQGGARFTVRVPSASADGGGRSE